MAALKFYRCNHCGNIIVKVHDSGVPVVCCGEPMQELVPNSTDAAAEKHVPVIEVSGDKVKVTIGSAPHPMADDHYIEWIYLSTEQGNQRKLLAPGDEPSREFAIVPGDKVVSAFAYCNKHGLWLKEL